MVLSCSTCALRARADGSCKNGDCPQFIESRTGGHWKLKRLQSALGDVANCFGDFVQGGCVASLRHRHDVRMGIASGMHLREHIASATLRLEVLCVLFLCYWKWPAACILKKLMRHVEELLGEDAQGRAALYERSWKEAMLMLRPTDFSVVCHRRQGTVELLPRAKVRRHGDYVSYHLLMNPATRRTSEIEFGILMEDLRSGRLADAIAKLAESFVASGATYSTCEVHLRSVKLCAKATYARTTFLRWLFKAVEVRVKSSVQDWALLAGKGSGAEKGLAAAGNITYEDAVAVCDLVSKDLWAASGAEYGLDDLVCFLCLSQNTEVVECEKLPQPAPPVTVASDLGSLARCAQVPRSRLRLKTPQAASGAAWAAAGSGVASPAGPPARRRPRWDVGLGFIMVLLPLPDQVRFSRSSRSELSKCLCHVRRWGFVCWEAVRELVVETLVGIDPALTASGVSAGTVCRAVGCALDLWDRLSSQPLPADVPLLGLALARFSLKLELTNDQVYDLREKFRAGGCLHKPGVERVECLLAMRI